MKDLLTPFEIEILLHHYYSPNVFPQKECEAYRTAVQKFRQASIIKSITDENDLIFEEGVVEAYVNEIRRVQLPVKTWVVPLIDFLS